MVEYIKNDITTLEEGIIVHGVNCQGVMGSGVAKAIKDKWPTVYTEYMSLFDNKPRPNLLGKSQLVSISDDLHIFNAFTQESYGRNGVYANPQAIQSAIENVIITTDIMGLLGSINMPMIGAGLGGLDWNRDVVPILEILSSKHDVLFTVNYFDK